MRLRGREAMTREALQATPEWARAQELLTRFATPPTLKLESDPTEPKKT